MAAAEDKYPEILKEFLESRKEIVPVKSRQELEMEKQAKDMLEFYGYEVSPNDPRFPILFEKMTEAKKKVSAYHPVVKYRPLLANYRFYKLCDVTSCLMKISIVVFDHFYFVVLIELNLARNCRRPN